jgi:Glycosyl transferases group 1
MAGMRLFQNSGAPLTYLSRHRGELQSAVTFKAQIARFLDHRYGALHFLAPVLAGEDSAFFTNGDDEVLQRVWARQMGMSGRASLTDILLAQIEFHRAEVFYNLDPIRYNSEFARKLPGCVRKTVAWRNIPLPVVDLGGYDWVVCNSACLLRRYLASGWKAAYFSPAHDPVMDEYAGNQERPIDVLFAGGYSRHHMRRAAVLEAVAGLRDRHRIEFCLARSRLTRLAESSAGYFAPIGKYRRPGDIRSVSREPVYGRDLYSLISKSKVVLNGAIDVSGEDRGNMRCFEAMGCSALLLSDAGAYPDGMRDGETLLAYSSPSQAKELAQRVVNDWSGYAEMAGQANRMIRTLYSKEQQWNEFCRLVT